MSNEPIQSKIPTIIGRYLRSRRRERGLTGKDVGEALNISQQQISRYERGTNRVTLEFLMSYVEVLGLPIEDFIAEFLLEVHAERLAYLGVSGPVGQYRNLQLPMSSRPQARKA